MKSVLLTFALGVLLAGPAYAQNTKGTGAENKTTTYINPRGATIPMDSSTPGHKADVPAGTNHHNDAATAASQDGLMGGGKPDQKR